MENHQTLGQASGLEHWMPHFRGRVSLNSTARRKRNKIFARRVKRGKEHLRFWMSQLRLCQDSLTNYRDEYQLRIANLPSERECLAQGWQEMMDHGKSLVIINETLANVLDAAELILDTSGEIAKIDVSLEALSYLDGEVQISSVIAFVQSVATFYCSSNNLLPQIGRNHCLSKILTMLPRQFQKLIPSVEVIVDHDTGLPVRPIGWKSVHDKFIRDLGSWCEVDLLQLSLVERFRLVASSGWIKYRIQQIKLTPPEGWSLQHEENLRALTERYECDDLIFGLINDLFSETPMSNAWIQKRIESIRSSQADEL